MQAPALETSRLVLSAHVAGDLPALHAMWSDPAVTGPIGLPPANRQDAWFRLLRYGGLWPMLGYGYWAVREKHTGRFAGDIGFADFKRPTDPPIEGLPEAGWALCPWAHGQGFASEALSAALHWLDTATDHRRAVCIISAANAPSHRVAAKAGFLPAGSVSFKSETTALLVRSR
jgi:RimJ/RimL family protein N-acetyltransferase